jgi:hypothetical protein
MDLRSAQSITIDVWRRARVTHPDISFPHLVEPKPAYFEQDVRLMIVGQETFGWGKEHANPSGDNDSLIGELLSCYAEFDLGAAYRATPFWDAANELFAALNPCARTRAYVWSNLVKLDASRHRVGSDIEDALGPTALLPLEVAAFRPDVVIFFSGPRYEARLAQTFPGASLETRSPFVARVVHPALPHRTFRTYHPKYLRLRRRWSVIADLISYCQLPNER